ncbi:MAG TPA: peptide-methionine (S)-S-oxide reductase MsrA [Gemmatimonadales bacterium]|nr:peptide-methionine (S)-S-oxide reductase MsrA [Gemmatimonadales bacterium]
MRRWARWAGWAGWACAAALLAGASASALSAQRIAHSAKPATETAVFSGGCFWGVQAVFEHVKGVIRAESGYTGGKAGDADYETVSTGRTGHAESVRVEYDPSQVTYQQLLDVFFQVAHDPTQLNRQGPDHGTQYRSAIWYTTPAQRSAAVDYIARLNRGGKLSGPVVTTVKPLDHFYLAEEYHQDYYFTHPDSPYIVYNDVPKVKALKRDFPGLWRENAVLSRTS